MISFLSMLCTGWPVAAGAAVAHFWQKLCRLRCCLLLRLLGEFASWSSAWPLRSCRKWAADNGGVDVILGERSPPGVIVSALKVVQKRAYLLPRLPQSIKPNVGSFDSRVKSSRYKSDRVQNRKWFEWKRFVGTRKNVTCKSLLSAVLKKK